MFKQLFIFTFALTTQAAADAYVVKSDRGGSLSERITEISHLQAAGDTVQIRGRVCYSTCTMYLGLPGACVDPQTIFGFHGPSRNGRPLTKKEFDYFSRVMARHYPAEIAEWFLATGRHKIRGVYKIKGADLIRQGLAIACA